MSILRRGVLEGRTAMLAGADPVLADALEQLGARTLPAGQPTAARALVLDTRARFGAGGPAALNDLLDHVWALVRECATAMIEAGEGGKLVLIAPATASGSLAGAARAALENMARTLSIEWARHAITACAVLPGPATTEPELAELAAYLLSPGGDYFTGCRFELR